MLQNVRVTVSIVFELSRENQQWVKLPSHTHTHTHTQTHTHTEITVKRVFTWDPTWNSISQWISLRAKWNKIHFCFDLLICVSSIVYEVIKTISSLFIYLFIYFFEKISHAQKHSQANINQQNKIKQTLNN